ncbi:uroporphyrinogen-III synthase [Streptomyces subrutilus]|uniref:uroporphyrinogen-III synthase n=1 Tax=Streptomyces subrutilus TaxID=36818 RepID=UPI0034435919
MRDDRQHHGPGPLAGFTVAVTAARADELIALLRGRGAAVVHAPAPRTAPPAEDAELRTATKRLIRRPPDAAVVTGGAGWRAWTGAADTWGIGAALRERLRHAELLAHGPEAGAAVRAAGLAARPFPQAPSPAALRDRLVAAGMTGRRVALLLHGDPPPGLPEALRAAGAEVVAVPVHRWSAPAGLAPFDRLLDAVAAGGVDALALTSPSAAAALPARAAERGMREAVLAALRGGVLAACTGPGTAPELRAHGLDPAEPRRPGAGPLVGLLCRELPGRARVLRVAGRRLEVRGHAVLLDAELRPVQPAPMALLRALARRPGRVVSRADLLRALPGAGRDEHAVESAVARLRAALGAPELIRTVVKRGYGLSLDADAAGDPPRPDPVRAPGRGVG